MFCIFQNETKYRFLSTYCIIKIKYMQLYFYYSQKKSYQEEVGSLMVYCDGSLMVYCVSQPETLTLTCTLIVNVYTIRQSSVAKKADIFLSSW